jgi:cytosol alanyl aminopeptidase
MFRVPLRAALAAFALVLSATAPRAEEAPDVRLGRDVVPTFQSIRLKLDADKRSYSGTTRTDLRVATATNLVRFHAEGQALKRVSLRQGADTIHVSIAKVDHGLVTLTADRALAAGTASLEIDFTHSYGTRAVGLYRVYKGGHGYLFTQFESDDAREAFPCWDEPGFKFPYQITLDVPAAHEAVSNTPIESQTEKDGWKTVVFAKTPPLPSYLLAIATGPLEFTPVPGPKYPVRIVTVQGQKGLTGYTAETTPKLLAALERWFGMPYPFAKLDLIAVPEFAYGAMENPGAITFREDVLLLDRANTTVSQKRGCVSVNCHELAHMWFGDLVTMAWWDDLWLNESFADWMAGKITDEVFPEFKFGLDDLGDIQQTMKGDALPSTQAIRAKTAAAAAGLQNVGLVYNKGNAVLATFEGYLGPETFQKGVRAYLKAHAWGNATASDLWKALDEASGQAVSASMATYTDQPGVPMVRVTPADGGVRLAQSRCTPWGIEQPAQMWRIPVVLRWSDGRKIVSTRVMLTEESQVVKLAAKPEWVMPNGGGRGYFAWSAPGDMIEKLAEHALEDLTPAERVSFLGNLNMLLDAGEVHGDSYLRALGHFGADPEPLVVSSVVTSLNLVRRTLVPDSAAATYAPYVRQTLQPALQRFGYERRPGEDEAISTMRGELLTTLAKDGRDEKVAAYAADAAKRYLADSSSVDPGIVDAVLQMAARKGDVALYEEFRARYEAATVPLVRRRFLGTLGAFEDPALEARSLRYMMSDTVSVTEGMTLMRGFMGKDEAAGERLFHWMMANYEQIAARIPPPALRFLPMMGGGCSEERLKATQAFFSDPARGIPGVEKTLERVADMVHGCISLRQREGAAVDDYLRSLGAK